MAQYRVFAVWVEALNLVPENEQCGGAGGRPVVTPTSEMEMLHDTTALPLRRSYPWK